jgi:hypothetical protein
MPTYRVYLRRPTTHPPVWDWTQTVVASNSSAAIDNAYSAWEATNPMPPAPPLSQCEAQTTIKSSTMQLFSSSISSGQQAFITEIQNQVARLLGSRLDGKFNVVNYPSGFNYGITYGNNAFFNQATLQDIDTLLSVASNGEMDLTGGAFSTLYADILQAIAFVFSKQDTATMNQQDTAASAQIASVLTEFTNAGGTYSNPLPFGGKLQDVFNQLNKTYGSLANLPPTLNALRNAIASYQSMAGASYALHNRYYAATARLAAAIANVTNPAASNGGMQVDNTDYFVGFTPNKLPTANQLIGGLTTAGNQVSMTLSLSDFTSTSSTMSISGGTGVEIPIADLLTISVSTSASYDLSRYTSSSSEVTMNMNYPGVTLFPSIPSALSTDNSTGWYANDILQEVVANAGQDATGYQLQGSEFPVDTTFGPGQTFSRLKTFVISQQPTTQLTFTGVDTSKVASDLQVKMSVDLNVLGFSVGSASGQYQVQNVDNNSSSGSITVTFGPPLPSGTIPLQNQVAYVLGGVASYPPNNI